METFRTITRRNLIRSAAVAAAAPYILPSRVWSQPTAPSKQITLGFIGMGQQNSGLLNGFLSHPNVRVLAVCDVDTTRREHAKSVVEAKYAALTTAGTYSGCTAYNDFQELLARKDIDGVVVATPDHWHALICIAAANAGKDIYCEKPMNHTILEGRAMVKAVRHNKRILQVGSMQRSMAEFRAACELIRNGVLGTVNKVDVAVGGPSVPCNLPEEPLEPGLDWDRWLGPAPLRPYNAILSQRGLPKGFPHWREYQEYGGGGVADWGAHHFDIVQWAFGFDTTGPTEFFVPDPAAHLDPQHGVRFRYPTGLEVTHMPGNGVTFYGDKGKLYVTRGKIQLWLGDQVKASTTADCAAVLKELLPANAVRLYQSSNQLTDWLNSIQPRTLPICDVETGHRTATICCLVNLTYAHKQDIKWDPKKEHFTHKTGDRTWLTREYRAPYKLA